MKKILFILWVLNCSFIFSNETTYKAYCEKILTEKAVHKKIINENLSILLQDLIKIINNYLDPLDFELWKKNCEELISAIEKSDTIKIKQLLNQDLDINFIDIEDRIPLIEASMLGFSEDVELLLQNSDINVNSSNHQGTTALIQACKYGFLDIVKLLLKKTDIDINATDKFNMTALKYASSRNFTDITDLLKSHKSK